MVDAGEAREDGYRVRRNDTPPAEVDVAASGSIGGYGSVDSTTRTMPPDRQVEKKSIRSKPTSLDVHTAYPRNKVKSPT